MDYYAEQGYKFGHPGEDYALPVGTPVLAAADGVVDFAGRDAVFAGRGIHVWIDHGNGLRTVYLHLNEAFALVGTHVKRGSIIGFSGYTGLVVPAGPRGAHLHWGVEDKVNGDPANRWFVDPAPLRERA